jgi:HEAT repeat protein
VWICQKCGEENNDTGDVCGDCGSAASWTPYGKLLQFSDPAWVRTVGLGMFWIFAGVVCYLLIFGLIMLDDLTRLNFYRPGDATWFFGTLERWCLVLPGIPPALMALIGGWLVTHPEAGEPATDGLFSSRNLARVWMVSACLWIAVAIQLTVAMALPVDRRFVEMLGVPLGLLAIVAWLAYARQLALRLPRTRLAFATRLLKWGITILLVPLVVVTLLGISWSLHHGKKWQVPYELVFLLFVACLIFVIWMAVLASRYARYLSQAGELADKREKDSVPASSPSIAISRPRGGTGEAFSSVVMVCAVLTVCGGVTLLWSQQQIRQLKKELQNEDSDVRVAAITAFRHFGRAAIEPLFDALNDEDPGVRASAVGAFRRHGPVAVPPLVDALEDEDKEVRESAVSLAGSLGKVAVSALVELLNDPEARLRRWGANPPVHGARGTGPLLFHAFSRMLRARNSTARGNRELTAALQLAAKDEDEMICYYAASTLTPGQTYSTSGRREWERKLKEGTGGRPLSCWIKHLNHEDPQVRMWAAYYVGVKDKAAIPVLIELLSHKDAGVREWAASTLEQFEADAKQAFMHVESEDRTAKLRTYQRAET